MLKVMKFVHVLVICRMAIYFEINIKRNNMDLTSKVITSTLTFKLMKLESKAYNLT